MGGRSTGEAVRARRKALAMTQAEAAEKAGWVQSRWADIEADRFSPTLDTLRRVAKALGCAVRDLV